MANGEKTRLNKMIAHAGYCTRREAAAWIKAGRVTVDGVVADNPGLPVGSDNVVLVDGEPLIKQSKPVYLLMNKPKGFTADAKEGKHMIGLVKQQPTEDLTIIAPLDIDQTGLHLLSNDDKLIQRMESKSTTIKTVYHVKLESLPPVSTIEEWHNTLKNELKYVIPLEDPYYNLAIESGLDFPKSFIQLMKQEKQPIIRIDRIYLAGLTKKDLPRGFVRPLTEKEVIMVKHFS